MWTDAVDTRMLLLAEWRRVASTRDIPRSVHSSSPSSDNSNFFWGAAQGVQG